MHAGQLPIISLSLSFFAYSLTISQFLKQNLVARHSYLDR